MASIILPTMRWTSGCDDVAADLAPEDQLLVVCDDETDPVSEEAPERATLVVAGEPRGCSGKANALAAGMERASDDVVVWSDDDVRREAGWRDRLVERAREHGAATEIPAYVGGGLWSLFEPWFAVIGSLGMAYSGQVWAGGVAFDRTEIDEEAFLADLRRTAGDSSLLSSYLEDPWIDHDHPRHIPVAGDPVSVYHRIVRFARTAFVFAPTSTTGLFGVSLAFAVGSFLAPLVGAALTTILTALAYRALDLRRLSVLLAYPSFLLLPVVLLAGVLAPSFVWGGRRYRMDGELDVTVLG